MDLRTECHPEANGRQPQAGDTLWTIHLPLEGGETLNVGMGKKGRDIIFGMLIADFSENGEAEPESVSEVKRLTTALQAANLSLQNCLLQASRMQRKDFSKMDAMSHIEAWGHIKRFCEMAGAGSILREGEA
jgi:hypothetical protein